MKAIGKLRIRAVGDGEDQVEVRVFLRSGSLVVHEPVWLARSRAQGGSYKMKRGDDYVVAHEPSTFKIAALPLPQARRAIEELAKLDWSSIPSDRDEVIAKVKADHPLAAQVAVLAGLR